MAAAVASPGISAPPDVVVGEADGFVDLPVTLSAPGQSSVSVAYATANSTAIGGTICNNSYVGVSGTLNFVPGDTTKVVRVAIQNAASVAGLLITTEAMVAELPQKNVPAMPGGGGGGGMGGMGF